MAKNDEDLFSNTEPKPQYYWGKMTKMFSNDDDTEMTQIDVTFLPKKKKQSQVSLRAVTGVNKN